LRQPLYNFAVVIDDHEMQISHVIRGEEHLANTPKQLAMAAALGIKSPHYAHLPIILSATGKGKMSKRDGGTTVIEYKQAGYLPEALINFLALLGWHPTGDNEMLSFDQMAAEFTIERVQKGGAKFDREKLDYFNQQYLKKLTDKELTDRLVSGGFANSELGREGVLRVVPLVRERMVKLSDFNGLADFFFALPAYDRAILVWKKSTAFAAVENLRRCQDLLRETPDQLFTKESLEPKLMAIGDQFGKGDVFWPLRVAVSGKEASPPPVDIVLALGKSESLRRIELALNKLGHE
jgi:nondiscriminating glutamyl-tRNA synthetase